MDMLATLFKASEIMYQMAFANLIIVETYHLIV